MPTSELAGGGGGGFGVRGFLLLWDGEEEDGAQAMEKKEPKEFDIEN